MHFKCWDATLLDGIAAIFAPRLLHEGAGPARFGLEVKRRGLAVSEGDGGGSSCRGASRGSTGGAVTPRGLDCIVPVVAATEAVARNR